MTNVSTLCFNSIKDMDERGKVLNMAFVVSASFVFGDHLAFTAGVDPVAIMGLMVAKLTSGICALLLALLITKKKKLNIGDIKNV